MRLSLLNFTLIGFLIFSCNNKQDSARRLEVLFLGHNSEHHESTVPAEILSRELSPAGINLSYTDQISDMNEENLKNYDAVVLYANYDSISVPQATALLSFVKSGKGFIPLHCASYCFRNNDEVVELIGGQFKSHKMDSFPSIFSIPAHPVLKGIQHFTVYDETYIHDKISKNITVITERIEGNHHEPYTWVRDYGKGRVFYTAYGHDMHTWNNSSFLQLVKNGILWAVGDEANKKIQQLNLPSLKYSDAKIPNYEKREPAPKLQAPLSPEESMQLTQVPPGFELQLFAAEPDIRKPIYMNWDERGRLWVIETVDYPNTIMEDKSEGDDRIKILEDTDGDGRADKFTVFADKLNIPSSFTFSNDGIIVSQAPYFLFLKDTDGDDHADQKDTLMTGWGTSDTHAGPSNLRYGFDNTIWGVVGYAGYKGLNDHGDSLQASQSIYHFNPTGKNLEFLGRTSNNTWGLGFSEEADVFVSTANNTHSAFLSIPQRYLNYAKTISYSGVEKIDGHYAMHVLTKELRQVDVHGGFTAAAGHSLYTARNFPKYYWNRVAFVAEPTGRVIHNAVLERNGSSFKEKDGWNMLASTDNWMGPIQAEVGPDGSLWVLDWYNFIIQHNPTPEGFTNGKGNAYEIPLRDTTRGRIYRIKYKPVKDHEILSLDKSKPDALVKALSSNNMFWRMTAQRMLVERKNTDVVPALLNIIKTSTTDEAGINAPATHALWTLHGLNAIENDKNVLQAVQLALKNNSAGVRKAALNVLPLNNYSADALITSNIFNDADLRVRLAAVLKAIDLPENKKLGTALFAMTKLPENINDKWIGNALYISSLKQKEGFPEQTASAKPIFPESVTLGEPERVITIKPIQNAMKFDLDKFEIKGGTIVEIIFDNIDFMQHNLLILNKGSLQKVGAAADALATDPKGVEINYVPIMPEVLYATPLVNPGARSSIRFRVPAAKGFYPYICSFPGHWRIMQGFMEVK